MDRNSSNQELVKEIVRLAEGERLKVRRSYCSQGGAFSCIGFSGDYITCQRLAEKIKSATGKDFWQDKEHSGITIFYFKEIDDSSADGFRGGW